MFTLILLIAIISIALISIAHADPLSDLLSNVFGGPRPDPTPHKWRRAPRVVEGGGSVVRASYYGGGEKLATHTASGEVFRPGGLTAAHRTLPLGTLLHVCYRGCTTVRVNDRGPAAWTGRSLDLSKGAAAAIGMTGAGVANVHMEIAGRE